MAMRLTTTDRSSHPTWWLYGGNHALMAWAGASFTSTAHAGHAAEDFRASAATARFQEILDRPSRTWRWHAWVGEDMVATSTTGFTTKQNARRAAHDVRDNVFRASSPLPA